MEIKINYDNNKATIEFSDAGVLEALLKKWNKLVNAFDEFQDMVNDALMKLDIEDERIPTLEELNEKVFEPLPF